MGHNLPVHVRDILGLPAWVLCLAPIGLTFAIFLIQGLYNFYFHPLSHIPGPCFGAFTKYYHSLLSLRGTYPFAVHSLHQTYGPVLRLAPNLVSFTSPHSLTDIYGHHSSRPALHKSTWYLWDTHISGRPETILNTRSPGKHLAFKKSISGAFSTKSLQEQEPLIHAYVDLLIKQIAIHATKERGADMVKWYNFATFDIIGDLAFGSPFGSLKEGREHEWVANIVRAIAGTAWFGMLTRHRTGWKWLDRWISVLVVPKKNREVRLKHYDYSRNKVLERLNMGTERKDFITNIINGNPDREPGELLPIMLGQGSVLIVAGSETTATFLAATTYHLCRTPHAYGKLTTEIRNAFTAYDSITGLAAEKLPYLNAVIDEGLRIFPPVGTGMPRVAPVGGTTVDGVFVPEGTEVFTFAWAATHSEVNFHKPDEFVPERWLDKGCKDAKAASQPFLLGPRVCLGRNLAMLEMRVILAKILWVYDMELKEPAPDWQRENRSIFLWEKPELPVQFRRRQRIAVPPID